MSPDRLKIEQMEEDTVLIRSESLKIFLFSKFEDFWLLGLFYFVSFIFAGSLIHGGQSIHSLPWVYLLRLKIIPRPHTSRFHVVSC